jgi:hypothetical protein
MAVRFDASGDYLRRTTNLPPIAGFTVMGWFKITTDRNNYSTFIGYGESSGFDWYGLATSSAAPPTRPARC